MTAETTRQIPPLPLGKNPCRWWWQTLWCHPPRIILGLLHEKCAWCGREQKWEVGDKE